MERVSEYIYITKNQVCVQKAVIRLTFCITWHLLGILILPITLATKSISIDSLALRCISITSFEELQLKL